MVPDPRSPVRGLLGALRTSRVLALALGAATGAGALAAATWYAHVSIYEYILLPLGVGGCTYYLTHYDLSGWNQDAMLRGFLRNFAIVSVPMMLVPDDGPLAEYVVSFVTVSSVVFFAVVTAVVDVVDADDDNEDGGVEDANTPSAVGAVDAD
jgi:hypothetical protein